MDCVRELSINIADLSEGPDLIRPLRSFRPLRPSCTSVPGTQPSNLILC